MGVTGGIPALPSKNADWHPRAVPPRHGQSSSSERPLAGIKVLDFGVIVVGAEAGRLLADQGADVIKIESSIYPDGARASATTDSFPIGFAMGHRNKRSLGLNVRDPRGKQLLLQLVRDSDVLLANFKGGTLASLGLDYEALKQVNPEIIVCESSAFGSSGPFHRRLGYGPLVRACSGLTKQWCYPGEPETFSDALTIYPDNVAARVAIIGVLSLLVRRRRSREGGHVSISQSEVILNEMAAQIAEKALVRDGYVVTDCRPISRVYRCAGDDEWCAVTIARDGRDDEAIQTVTSGLPLKDWLATQSPRAAMAALQASGIAAGAMLRVSELATFDYYTTRGTLRPAEHPLISEKFSDEGILALSEQIPAAPRRPAPLQSQHTEEIMSERLGLGIQEIEELVLAGVLERSEPIPRKELR